MANGNEAVKNIADYITTSNEDDGVAEVFEKFVLKNDILESKNLYWYI